MTTTEKAIKQNFAFEQAETVRYFTQEYFRLVERNGKPTPEQFEDEIWTYGYWSLLNTEFYFFHVEVIPFHMFTLWMADLADLYTKTPKAWQSHIKFLGFYNDLYPEMREFFKKINEFSKIEGQSEKHRKMLEFVSEWITQNRNSKGIIVP